MKKRIRLTESRFKQLVFETARKIANNKRKRTLNEGLSKNVYLLYKIWRDGDERVIGVYSSPENMLRGIINQFGLQYCHEYGGNDARRTPQEYYYDKDMLLKDLLEHGRTNGFDFYGRCELGLKIKELNSNSYSYS